MKSDIMNRDDIKLLIDQFYYDVKRDSLIGSFFTEAINVDWDHHLPQMYNFWESILFSRKVFSGNPMQKHIALNAVSPLSEGHFNCWIKLFHTNVNRLFEGKNAERIKLYAETIKENLAARTLNSSKE